ncbi:aldose epimerase family protein [Frateuria aurantia]|uniref:Aldose 1-epimerase n=1 Tax=Frateuria aurantia (strain ATCC 33424 / DSM 6220 / KCTC 2777 / LMG 1558 / NBRC 3245 / NCIMB 13370) TaxID=767434 RepID=H8KZR2_FRAAD|nr:aldose epimerase family protein [Frateuria aurantia]AFC84573.1 galactose mutarotase-like enzyme [Frateuria aurantia DSM 6220]
MKPKTAYLSRNSRWALAIAMSLGLYAQAQAAEGIQVQSWGSSRHGQAVSQYTLTNADGMVVKFISYGGILTDIEVPDRHGNKANVLLGFANLKDYESYNGDIHFGALIGRYANRIAKGRFSLDGKDYQLEINNPPNTLHSGFHTFDDKVWTVKPLQLKDAVGAELSYVSPDGENGFPGRLTTHVRYILDNHNALHIQYQATTDKDTVLNLTNHSYFNLGGEGSGSVENEQVQIFASHYTPTDATSIPTGEVASVAGTPLDFRQPTVIAKGLRSSDPQLVWAHGYDNNLVLDHPVSATPALAARVYDPASGRQLELFTTQPGLQFYTANGLNGGVVGSTGKTYRQGDAFAMEAEHFPDSPNHPQFPSTELKPGQIFRQETVLSFSTR